MADQTKLLKYLETASPQGIGATMLTKLSEATNAQSDFEAQAHRIMREVYRLIDMAQELATAEAEARYVTYLREANRQEALSNVVDSAIVKL